MRYEMRYEYESYRMSSNFEMVHVCKMFKWSTYSRAKAIGDIHVFFLSSHSQKKSTYRVGFLF